MIATTLYPVGFLVMEGCGGKRQVDPCTVCAGMLVKNVQLTAPSVVMSSFRCQAFSAVTPRKINHLSKK